MKIRSIAVLLGAAGLTVGLSACGGGYDTPEATSNAAPAPVATTEAAPKQAGTPQVLTVAKVDKFEPFLVNAKGRTIYRFDNDLTQPPTTRCLADCAKTWEPVLVGTGGLQISGNQIEQDQVGTIARPDGGEQVTLKGWPLYYFKDDLRLGQTAGHGVGGKWFAITPTGGKAQRVAGGQDSTQSGGGYTY
ncbi:hypothetical protein GCM10027290_28320 [Micromonospora sonneratiae]|uniref:Lipoprotein with Yx(FWY)xxD motif n=1 Tax=Micromonospora sonneratiae TaxID=1184706 RepID=A0ABW3Y7C2_9ACTN